MAITLDELFSADKTLSEDFKKKATDLFISSVREAVRKKTQGKSLTEAIDELEIIKKEKPLESTDNDLDVEVDSEAIIDSTDNDEDDLSLSQTVKEILTNLDDEENDDSELNDEIEDSDEFENDSEDEYDEDIRPVSESRRHLRLRRLGENRLPRLKKKKELQKCVTNYHSKTSQKELSEKKKRVVFPKGFYR